MRQLIRIFIFLSFTTCFAQHQKIVSATSSFINFDADYFVGCDGFENYFYVKDNILFKKNLTSFLQYQNLSLGKLAKVDITNPLKIILFYEKFNAVIVLDNQLNEIQNIDFSKNEVPIVTSAIGISGQNQLWIYNTLDQQIGLYDLNTNFYKNLGIPIKENFIYYQTDFNNFHWIDKQNQWMTCSVFGRVTDNGMVDSFDQIQIVNNDKLLYNKGNQLFYKDISTNKIFEIEIVEKSFDKFYFKDQILSIFTSKGISNYKIILP